MNKPQTFSILGKEHQLKSIWEDLKELGYTLYKEDFIGKIRISNDYKRIETKEMFSSLCTCSTRERSSHVNFQLPQQYQEALDFAKEQINHPYWDQDEYKVGDWVTVIGFDERYSYSLYHGELGKSYLITKINKSGLFFNETDCLCKTVIKVRKATEEEIKSELLKQANERYPIGCKFKSICGFTGKIYGGLIWGWSNDKDAIFTNTDYRILYCDGKWAEIIKPLYFGKNKFIVENNQYATTAYGNITKEELKTAIDYIENPPKLCGYNLTIHSNEKYSSLHSFETLGLKLGFGCQSGKLSELKEIYKAICEF